MALTKKYVSTAGGGAHDGTSDANAFTWDEMITDINTLTTGGVKYLVKSGTYSRTTTNDAPTGDGNATSPFVVEGYNTTEGDLLTNGRDADGNLVTTNFPEITYTTGRLNVAGSDFSVWSCLKVTSASTSAAGISAGTSSVPYRCHITSSGTNANSAALQLSDATGNAVDCDVYQTGGSGGAPGILVSGANAAILGCRAKSATGSAIKVAATGVTVSQCDAYESVIGIEVTASTTSVNTFVSNTIVNNSGNGIDFVAGLTGKTVIVGNHITGSGGFGVDWNAAACPKIMCHNRFRDNASGSVSGGDDWEEGTSVNNITSNDTDADDFTDQANDDYSLLTTAPAIIAGVGYRNPIGAHGAGSFGSGGGTTIIGVIGS